MNEMKKMHRIFENKSNINNNSLHWQVQVREAREKNVGFIWNFAYPPL